MRNFFKNIGDLFISELDQANSNFYIVASRYSEWENEPTAENHKDTYKDGEYDMRNELIFGKKISSSDISYLIDRNVWSSGTVYDIYDDTVELSTKKFFVVNAVGDVFKCLNNNKNSQSTIQPVTKTIVPFTLADGYTWKYMYTVTSANFTKFGSLKYIPVTPNNSIISASTRGTIDHIIVENGGNGYIKYYTGEIQGIISNKTLKIDSQASSNTNFYVDNSIYFSTGNESGNIYDIVDHYANSSGIYITTSANCNPSLNSSFVISPKVSLVGDGNGFKSYCSVNTISKKIESVHVVNSGNNYNTANVSIYSNSTLYGSGAVLRAVISPTGGHGSDPYNELNAEKLIVVTKFDGTEANNIPTEVKYRKYGLVKNIKYSNNTLISSSTFDATNKMNLNIITTGKEFEIGEIVQGKNSGAKAKVSFANNSVIYTTKYSGLFSNNEIITGLNSNTSAIISNINISTINNHSGEIIFYNTTSTITRSPEMVEEVGFVISNTVGK